MNKKKYLIMIVATLAVFYALVFAVVPALGELIPKSYLVPTQGSVDLPPGFEISDDAPAVRDYSRNIIFGRNVLTGLVTVLGAAAVFVIVKAPAKP